MRPAPDPTSASRPRLRAAPPPGLRPVALLAALALLAGLPVGCGDETGARAGLTSQAGLTARECRQQWADLSQLHSENGDPGGPVPALERRWRHLDRLASRYADEATRGDCGTRFDRVATRWGAVETLEYDLAPYDPRRRLELAEGDRRHWVELQEHFGDSTMLPAPVRRAFRVARRAAPRAIADLAPALAPGADVVVTDVEAVSAYLASVRAAARESAALHRFDRAIALIARAELHEE